MKTQQRTAIDNHIQKLGFEDIYSFALHQLIETNESQLADNQIAITAFEEKYSMEFTAFQEQFHDIAVDHFEKEDDSMEWEVRLAMYEEITNTLIQLKDINTLVSNKL